MIRIITITLIILLSSVPTQAPEKMIFSTFSNSETPNIVLARTVVSEGYNRLDMDIEVRYLPGYRALRKANNGKVDGLLFHVPNATQLHQVMMNLCTNAAQAMEDGGGAIEVSISDIPVHMIPERDVSKLPDKNYIEIRMSGTGVGIAPDTSNAIFEPYYTTKDPGEGTGMGLAVVQDIPVILCTG